jgi:hypothetical protein
VNKQGRKRHKIKKKQERGEEWSKGEKRKKKNRLK